MTNIQPTSLAGILLREHDTAEQALRYAERMAQRCADARSTTAFEYADAAEQLRAMLRVRAARRVGEPS